MEGLRESRDGWGEAGGRRMLGGVAVVKGGGGGGKIGV